MLRIILGLLFTVIFMFLQIGIVLPSARTDREERVITWQGVYGGSLYECARSIQQTSDGGYIFAGYTSSYGAGKCDFWVVKLDREGNKVWDRTFGGREQECATSIQQTVDGGYIVAGTTSSYGAGDQDLWVVRIDKEGNKLWDKTFGGSGYEEGAEIQPASDEGFLLAGNTHSFGFGSRLWIIRLDGSGNRLWDRTFGGYGTDLNESADLGSIHRTLDGGYVIASLMNNGLWLITLDEDGNKLWDKTYIKEGNFLPRSIRQTADRGYIVAGSTESYITDDEDIRVMKLDDRGTIQWDTALGKGGRDFACSAVQMKDGGYAVAGSTTSYIKACHIWLLKLDSRGNKVWGRLFGGERGEIAASIEQTSDDGLIVAGETMSQGFGKYDALVLKLDSNGNCSEHGGQMDDSQAPLSKILSKHTIEGYQRNLLDNTVDPSLSYITTESGVNNIIIPKKAREKLKSQTIVDVEEKWRGSDREVNIYRYYFDCKDDAVLFPCLDIIDFDVRFPGWSKTAEIGDKTCWMGPKVVCFVKGKVLVIVEVKSKTTDRAYTEKIARYLEKKL